MRPIRTAAVFAVLILASAIVAPAVGAFQELENTGTTGLYTSPDDALSRGVNCKYENNPGKRRDEIDVVKSKRMWTHGPYTEKTWVGHRIVVLKNAKPYGDGIYRTVWKSPIIKKLADDMVVATFKGRAWKPPENSKARYRVQPIFFYYEKGSKTKLEGRVRGLLDTYNHKMAKKPPKVVGTDGGPAGTCYQIFHAAP